MAERKTAEIKFRIEPSRKARFQQAAADEGIGLSEFLVLAAEDRVWAASNQKLDGNVLLNEAVSAYRGVATHEGGGKFSYDPPLPESAAPSSNPFAGIPSVATSDAAPTKCGDGAVQEERRAEAIQEHWAKSFKPWESQ